MAEGPVLEFNAADRWRPRAAARARGIPFRVRGERGGAAPAPPEPGALEDPRMADTDTLRCPGCGATNRVRRDKLDRGLAPLCGRCKTPLLAARAPVTVTDATFGDEVERSPLPVLVDAWAPWCGPCRRIAPVIEELAAEMAGRARVAKLNVDENPRTAARFDLRSIPTLLVFASGREVDRMVGVHPKAEIVQRLERALA
jgi:thioredoxin 2